MHRGYIKLWRKFEEWEWYSSPSTKDLFLHLIIKANHKPFSFMGVRIERGEVAVGRHSLSRTLGFSESQIRTAIKNLQLTKEIKVITSHKFSIITVINYEQYQDGTLKEFNQKMTNLNANQLYSENEKNSQPKSPDNRQPIATIKECKNEKNILRAEAISYFQASFKNFYGGKDYFWEYGKDDKAIRSILDHFELPEIKRLIDLFFKSKDQFVINGKHTLCLFRSQVNKLQTIKPRADPWKTAQTI